VLLTGTVGAALAIWATPASAQYIHGPYSAEYGPTGAASPGFSTMSSLAYQQAEKKLYVLADFGIYGFSNPSQGTLTPLGNSFPITVSSSYSSADVAVDNSAGATAGHIIYASESQTIVGFNSAGSSLGWTINLPSYNCGVAVDNEGHIWDANNGTSSVIEYPAEGGSAITTIPTGPSLGAEPCKIGVDTSNNDVYPAQYFGSGGLVAKFTKASNYTSYTTIQGGSYEQRVAINPAKGVIYLGGSYGIPCCPSNSKIQAFDTSTGTLLDTFTLPEGNPRGIAVQNSTDTVFVSSTNGKVYEFRGINVPKPTTGEPVANSTVGGTADTDSSGEITNCEFEFGPTESYGGKQPCTQTHVTEGESPKAVEAALPGLIGEHTYHYRLVLTNAEGKNYGGDKTIVPHNVINMKTEAASAITRTTAQLNGSFTGTNDETTYFFEYGTSESYGKLAPAVGEKSAGATTGPTPMSEGIAGLTPDTTYHFRVVAKNARGTNIGADETFKTPLAVQGVDTEPATDQTRTTAVLHGSFTGNGEHHTYVFEYGPTTAYGQVVSGDAGTATGKVPAEKEVAGLEVQLPTSLPYHYRLAVTNSTGTTYGPDETFLTAPPAMPEIRNESSEGVTPTSAQLHAEVFPGEGETVYVFEYGPDTEYGSSTAISPSVGNDLTFHAVSNELTGLAPGTTYHFRAVAFNFSGTVHGEDLTFTTPDVPRIESSGASGVTPSAAHLTMAVSGNASPTNVHFEYGPTAAYGTSTPSSFVGSSQIVAAASADIGGLIASTTYHYRAVAVNAIGTTTGPDQTFSTLPLEVAHEEEKPVSCRKGFVRRHGKCVKRHHRKHKRHHRRHG
jgi:DNA-binding beta-propeller fold protein YncE/phosphodiesterase/alkaline phosphatase D-like protein